jgi:hypothetical protein
MDEPRRYLLMKSGWEVSILWLDQHGSCSHSDSEGSLYHSRFHMKRDDKGRVFVALCPNGLEREEWARVFVDDPEGSWKSQFLAYKDGPPKRSVEEL